MDQRPYRDIISGRKVCKPNPLNKIKLEPFELDEYFLGVDDEKEKEK